jgi:hypothetical protein
MFLRTRRFAMVSMLVAVVLALTTGTGGVMYAADAAVPGDPLYGLDLAMESAQLRVTREPQPSTELLLSFAEERLLEAVELSGRGDRENLDVALSGYGATISSLARALGAVEGADEMGQAVWLDEAFSAHEALLAEVLGDGDEETQEANGSGRCNGVDPHPAGERLAGAYGVDYEEVMGWFCDGGDGFGEIMHALQTSQESSLDPAEGLLSLKTELGGWGKVWQHLGLIGPPDDTGPPDHAGLPDVVPPDVVPPDVVPPDGAGPPGGG